MKRINRWMVAGLMIAIAQLAGCQGTSTHTEHQQPAEVTHIDGSELSLVTLTPKAISRIGLETGKVTEQKGPRKETLQKAVPYSALLYDSQGKTWVYKSPEPRVFVRHEISVDYIEGELAYLTDGPATGTELATVGVAELYGTEFEVGH